MVMAFLSFQNPDFCLPGKAVFVVLGSRCCFVCDGPPCVPQAGLGLRIDSPVSVGQGAGVTGGTSTTSNSNKTNFKVLKDVRVTVSALKFLNNNSASHGLEA